MTPAGKLQDRIKERVQKSGGYYRKVRWEARNGCPDVFIWWQWPCLAFIEVKAGKDRFSTIQSREVRRLAESGIPVFTVRTLEEVDIVVEQARKGIARNT